MTLKTLNDIDTCPQMRFLKARDTVRDLVYRQVVFGLTVPRVLRTQLQGLPPAMQNDDVIQALIWLLDFN